MRNTSSMFFCFIENNINSDILLYDKLYVMLMLMRSEGSSDASKTDCDDPIVALACQTDSDACPAECKEDSNKNDDGTVVKSGDLAVKAVEKDGASVISENATSELDTLTFKASEDITLNSVTLERYGLSNADAIDSIWLENEDGDKVTAEKSLSTSKDTVTLSLKKDYKNMGTEASFIVVVRTANKKSVDLGTNIGFKVIDVDSSAKNLDKSNYKANLYNFVDYSGNGVTVAFKGATSATTKSYNFKEGEFYEVAKFRVSASKAAVKVDGFTLTRNGNLDLKQYVDEVEILVDGNKIDNVKSSLKNDELTVSFDPQEIAINKNSTFTVRISLVSDFDRFGDTVNFKIDESSDLSVKESKNDVRVKVSPASTPVDISNLTYVFNGGKINLDNTKLSATIEAGQGSEGITIAKGKISVGGQAIRINNLTITPTITGDVANVKLIINKEEYEATNANGWKLGKITIDEDSDVEITVDLEDGANRDDKISFKINGKDIINGAALSGLVVYDTNSDPVTDIAGSISVSEIKVQKAKGSLTKDKTNTVEYKVKDAATTKSVFEGTFTAKKQNTHLNNIKIELISGNVSANDSITFVTYIKGEKVATFDFPAGGSGASENADITPEVVVASSASVDVKIEAKVYASEAKELKFKVSLDGEDDNNNPLDLTTAELQTMKFVDNESVIVSTTNSIRKQDVILTDANQVLAAFDVKPGNKSETAALDHIEISLTGSGNTALFDLLSGYTTSGWTSLDASDYFELTIGTTKLDIEFDSAGNIVADDLDNISVQKAGANVKLTYTKDDLTPGTGYAVTVTKVNKATPDIEFTRYASNAIVRVVSQKGDKASKTNYQFEIEYANNANEKVESLTFTYKNNIEALSGTTKTWTNIQQNTNYSVDNNPKANYVQQIAYVVNDENGTPRTTTLNVGDYEDFFKVVGETTELQAYAND